MRSDHPAASAAARGRAARGSFLRAPATVEEEVAQLAAALAVSTVGGPVVLPPAEDEVLDCTLPVLAEPESEPAHATEIPAAAASTLTSSSSALQVVAPAPAAGPAVEGSHLYVVWKAPGALSDLRGIHHGGRSAWRRIESQLPNQRYPGSAARLRRMGTLAEATQLYLAEAPRHGAPIPPPHFFH